MMMDEHLHFGALFAVRKAYIVGDTFSLVTRQIRATRVSTDTTRSQTMTEKNLTVFFNLLQQKFLPPIPPSHSDRITISFFLSNWSGQYNWSGKSFLLFTSGQVWFFKSRGPITRDARTGSVRIESEKFRWITKTYEDKKKTLAGADRYVFF